MSEARETTAQRSTRKARQAGPGQMTQLSNIPAEQKRELTAVPKDRLVKAFLASPTVADRDTRNVVVEELPPEIEGNIRRYPADQFDVASIVATCLNYTGGIEQLIENVARYEGESLPVQEIRRVWSTVPTAGAAADFSSSQVPETRPTLVQQPTRQPQEQQRRESPVVVVSFTLLDRLGEDQKRLDAAVKGYIKSKEQVISCTRVLSHLGLGELDPDRLGNADFWITARDRVRDIDCPAVGMPECEGLRAQFEKQLKGVSRLVSRARPGLPEQESGKVRSDLSSRLEEMCRGADTIAGLCEDAAREALATIAADIAQIFRATAEGRSAAPSVNPSAGHR